MKNLEELDKILDMFDKYTSLDKFEVMARLTETVFSQASENWSKLASEFDKRIKQSDELKNSLSSSGYDMADEIILSLDEEKDYYSQKKEDLEYQIKLLNLTEQLYLCIIN